MKCNSSNALQDAEVGQLYFGIEQTALQMAVPGCNAKGMCTTRDAQAQATAGSALCRDACSAAARRSR